MPYRPTTVSIWTRQIWGCAAYGIHSGHTSQSGETRTNKKVLRNSRREQTSLLISTIGSGLVPTSPSLCGAHNGLKRMGRMLIYVWLSITHQQCRAQTLGAQKNQKLSMRCNPLYQDQRIYSLVEYRDTTASHQTARTLAVRLLPRVSGAVRE